MIRWLEQQRPNQRGDWSRDGLSAIGASVEADGLLGTVVTLAVLGLAVYGGWVLIR